MKIGIAGFGFVGQALYSGIIDEHLKDGSVVIYDKFISEHNNKELLSDCEVIFICLPTPTIKGKLDYSAIDEFFKDTNDYMDYPGGPLFIIRSTLNLNYQTKFVDLDIIYNPEFLDQNNSAEMFQNQKHIILGGRMDLCKEAAKVYGEMFNLPNLESFKYCSIEDAINTKYITNIYPSLKISFWNYVNEITGNYRKIMDLYNCALDQEGTPHMPEKYRICSDGKPGFGGACLPKDLIAYNSKHPHPITQTIIDYNTKLRPEDMEQYLR